MTCCKNKTITIYQGFGTRWDDQDLLTVTFKSDVDIDGFGAEFLIGNIKKTYENIQDGFGINLTAQETATLPLGPNTGTLVIIDTENNKRPFSTELPFMVKDWAEGDIKLDGFDLTIDAKIQDNLLIINIESARAGDVEPTIDRKISEHNSSEQAHPYIRGLISSEEEARIAADGILQGNIDTVSASIKNGTLTIQKNGTTVQTFSANQSSNVTANLIIPTKTSDITNDSDFATNSGVSTAVSNHNTSEEAHSYIQGLISSEENRAKGVEGALTSLTTDTKTNLVSAINEVDSHTDTNTTSIGTLSNLTTEAKTNLVSAINEVDSHTDTNTNNIGTLTSLTTTDKTNLVSAINEVNGAISSEVTRAEGVEGTLTNLTTDSKTNLVSAINEVDSHTDTNTSNIGTLTSLTTDAQSNLVAAINEVDSHADTNASSIGTLTSLTTDAKTNLVSAINEIDSHADTNAGDISDIKDLIPAEATPSNQLADKEFVNSSISTNTANFIGTFDSVSSLEGYSGTVTNNDYAFVINGVVTDNGNDWATFADLDAYDKTLLTNFDYAWVVNGSNFDLYRFDIVEQDWDLRVSDTQKSAVTLNTAYNRYKATVSGNVVTWAYEYTLNNSSFTAAQWASINSGATDTLIGQITTNENSIGTLSSLTTSTKTDLVSAINELDTDKVEANTAITGATKCKITYDSKGLVTGGANLEASDIPSLTLSKISDVSATASEVNVLDGITASTAELNILDGVTANATEINVLDGITASTSELNVLDGITATTTELNYVDGVTSSIQTQLDGKVPTARTINNKALTSDITLDASDVGALPNTTVVPTINSSNNYVPFRSSATAFSNSTLMYNSNAMAFTGRLHVGSSSPASYYSKGRFTIYDNTPSQQVSSLALLNYGGGGGCGVAIDMYNTGANGGIPSGRFGVIDNGNYSGYLQLQVKKSGAQSNPLLPAMNIVPVPAANSLTTCVSFGQDEFNRVLFDLHKPEATTTITDSDKRWGGSGTTYQVTGSNKFNPRLLVAVGDIVSFNNFSTETTVTGVVSNSSTLQITTDKTLGTVSNANISVKKAYFKITDENYNTKVYVDPYGKFGIGTGTPSTELDVSGTINASTDIKIGGNSLATVSKTGSYNDLIDTPTIPSTASEVGALPDTTTANDIGGANKYLSNLTSTGKNIGNWSSNVTNCITYIPQNIKLELDSGTLTLKAGSKVFVPNGVDEFDEITISSDLTTSGVSYAKPCFVLYNSSSDSISIIDVTQCQSGSTTPTSAISGVYLYYNTTTNKIYTYSGGAWGLVPIALPLCVVNMQTSTPYIESIEQIFQGIGYIGSTVFALPNIRGLIPSGRNADGTLSSTEFTTPSVLVTTFQNTFTADAYIALSSSLCSATRKTMTAYDEKNNFIIQGGDAQNYMLAGNISTSAGVIQSLTPKNVYEALDSNDGNFISAQSMPSSRYVTLTLGSTGASYTAPANGYFSLGGNDAQNVNGRYVMRNDTTRFGVTSNTNGASVTTGWIAGVLPVRKGDIVHVYYNGFNSTGVYFIFVYAEGEA